MLFAVSDLVWQALIAGIVTVVIAWMQQRTKSAVDEAAKVAVASADTAAIRTEQVAAKQVIAAQKVEQVAIKQESAAKATADKLNDAAGKVAEVKDALKASDETTANKLDDIAKTGEAIHVLVNSSMSAQLKISMIALKRVAELTRHPDDLAASQLAEKLYHEHEAKQAKVDGMTGGPPKISPQAKKGAP
jgi:hypothetical protein